MHEIIPKGIVGSFEFTVLQKIGMTGHGRLFGSARGKQQKQVRQLQSQEQCIDHIPYYLSGLSPAHFSDNLSRNSCIEERQLNLQVSKERRHKVKFPYHQQRSSGSPGRDTASIRYLQSRIRYAKSDSTTKPTLTKMLLTIPAAVRLLICVISMQ